MIILQVIFLAYIVPVILGITLCKFLGDDDPLFYAFLPIFNIAFILIMTIFCVFALFYDQYEMLRKWVRK